jgi:hypothetical protein
MTFLNADLINCEEKLVFPNYLFIIAIGILTTWLTFLTVKGSLTDRRYNGFYDWITKRGKIVFFVSSLMIIILCLQECNNQNSNDNKDCLLNKEHAERDSLVSKQVELSRQKLYGDLSKAFLKQYLKLDTLNTTIINIRDSVKTVVNDFSQEDPILVIDTNGVKLISENEKTDTYNFAVRSKVAGSSEINVIIDVLVEYNDQSFDLIRRKFGTEKLRIPKENSYNSFFEAPKGVNKFYILLKGSYKTIDKTKSYLIDDAYEYSKYDKKTFFMKDSKKIEFLKFIKKFPQEKILYRE